MRLPAPTTDRLVGALVLPLLSACVLLTILTRDPWPSNDGLLVALVLAFIAVGLVIVQRQARNAVGWLMLCVGLSTFFDLDVKLYAALDYRRGDGSLPLGHASLYFLGSWSLLPILIGLPAILLFPDGRPASPRWRRVLWTYAGLAVLFMLAQYIGQAGTPIGRPVRLDIRGVPANTNNNPGSVAAIGWVIAPLFLVFWGSFVGHQVATWRRSAGDEREQLKWLMSGGAVCVVSCIALVMGGDGPSATAPNRG